ncbi:hypothetical protein N8T08_006748 [Aspergillus melleus]|uniref:Uncharacterized protein n=1 Tax=Aspergillus melleus TaxID=138277 RepID=A0ACC3AZJ4_9EURO|nr:hypothetical protein N8T08_006748 [Aspergillus melleus]
MKISILLPLTALLSFAAAAESDSCLQNCLTKAGSATGCKDTSCACSNAQFKGQVQNCVSSCPAGDKDAAKQLQKQC